GRGPAGSGRTAARAVTARRGRTAAPAGRAGRSPAPTGGSAPSPWPRSRSTRSGPGIPRSRPAGTGNRTRSGGGRASSRRPTGRPRPRGAARQGSGSYGDAISRSGAGKEPTAAPSRRPQGRRPGLVGRRWHGRLDDGDQLHARPRQAKAPIDLVEQPLAKLVVPEPSDAHGDVGPLAVGGDLGGPRLQVDPDPFVL